MWRFVTTTLLAMVGCLLCLSTPESSRAATVAKWDVYPGLQVSGIWDYGWHFDEAAADSDTRRNFGARDYNFTNDSNAAVKFKVKLTTTPQYQLRWRFAHSGSDTVVVITQANFFGWVDVDRTEMHYKHLCNRIASGTTTAAVWNVNDTITLTIGNLGSGGCGTPSPHVHQSSYQRTDTRIPRDNFANDTCWSDTDNFTGTDLHQCPLTTYRTHNGVTVGDPCGAPSGNTWLISGNLTEYFCEEWSLQPRSHTTKAFHGLWTN